MIVLKNITKEYEKNIKALDDINLHIKEGTLVILKGVSGSGKSSILSPVAGLMKPTSGEVIVDAKQISKLPDHFASLYRRENIGFVFQKYNLIGSMSVRDNILLPLVPQKISAHSREDALTKVLKDFEIEDKKESLVKNLSGGERQRVAIARAIINEPKILLADEPTANLDAKLSLAFIEILRVLKGQNRTIIIATHDPLFFDLDIVDEIIEVQNAKIV